MPRSVHQVNWSRQTEKDAEAIQFLARARARNARTSWRRAMRRSRNPSRRRPPCGRDIRPSDDAVAPEQRQRVIPELALRHGRVRLEAIGPAPEDLEPPAIPDDRDRMAPANAPRRPARSWRWCRLPANTSPRRPRARARVAVLARSSAASELAGPLRRRVSQVASPDSTGSPTAAERTSRRRHRRGASIRARRVAASTRRGARARVGRRLGSRPHAATTRSRPR